jgi:uncharacterized tellurite resistance protein B-like protein
VGWRDWLRVGDAGIDDPTRTEVVSRIAGALEGLPPDRARVIAAFAYHLGRIAHADHEFTDGERNVIHAMVTQESGLPVDQVDLVVELVVHESLVFRGTEDYAVMREFGEIATAEQKAALIRCLFAVSAADARVVVSEDNEIRRIAMALKVSHEEFVAARAAVRAHLAVLQRPASPGGTASPDRDPRPS